MLELGRWSKRTGGSFCAAAAAAATTNFEFLARPESKGKRSLVEYNVDSQTSGRWRTFLLLRRPWRYIAARDCFKTQTITCARAIVLYGCAGKRRNKTRDYGGGV